MICDAIHEAVGDGPPDEEVDAAAAAIIGMMDGLQVQWLLEPEIVNMPASVRLVLEALLARWGHTLGTQSGSAVRH